jgi:hypothetical protein
MNREASSAQKAMNASAWSGVAGPSVNRAVWSVGGVISS